MNVNGISTNALDTRSAQYKADTAKKPETAEKETDKPGAVYEPSKDKDSVKGLYKQNTALVNQMKADADMRMNQMQDIVSKLLQKQGTAANQFDDMWKLLAKGDLKASPDVVAKAKEDISEDGYWGVKQTSDRIIDFAKALTGGDPSKIDLMQEAFEKGYKQAMGAWGRELPEISQKTYDAVTEKFDAWRAEYETTGAVQ